MTQSREVKVLHLFLFCQFSHSVEEASLVRMIDFHTGMVAGSITNLLRWFTTSVASVADSSLVDHETKVDADGKRHFQTFC